MSDPEESTSVVAAADAEATIGGRRRPWRDREQGARHGEGLESDVVAEMMLR